MKGGDTLRNLRWSVVNFQVCSPTPILKFPVTVTNLEWILQANGRPIMLSNNKQKSYSYQLQVNGFNPFRPSELSGMRCVSQVAH